MIAAGCTSSHKAFPGRSRRRTADLVYQLRLIGPSEHPNAEPNFGTSARRLTRCIARWSFSEPRFSRRSCPPDSRGMRCYVVFQRPLRLTRPSQLPLPVQANGGNRCTPVSHRRSPQLCRLNGRSAETCMVLLDERDRLNGCSITIPKPARQVLDGRSRGRPAERYNGVAGRGVPRDSSSRSLNSRPRCLV
jgi:hypothetical protein